MQEMKTKVRAENSIPPLKNLEHIWKARQEAGSSNTYAFPSNSTPVPTKDFNNWTTINEDRNL